VGELREIKPATDDDRAAMLNLLREISATVEKGDVVGLSLVVMADGKVSSYCAGQANRLEHLGMLDVARDGLLRREDW